MFIRSLQFRTELIIYILLDILPFFVLLFIWQAVYAGKESINAMTLPEITQYYILVMFVERFTSTHFETWRAREIREGKIDYFLTRPFSYLNEVFSKDVGGKIITLIISVPTLLIFAFILTHVVPVAAFSASLTQLSVFMISMVAAYLMQFMVALWIVLLTFWFEGSSGLEHFKWITISLFSGATLPVTFMPDWLQTLYNLLPFKYMYSVPILQLQGKLPISLQSTLELLLVLVSMVGITLLIWDKAKYKYSSAGG
jgi:ABC-2 type transport system permease protein